jgi:SMI1 / KNR4 family (SUKH-1)
MIDNNLDKLKKQIINETNGIKFHKLLQKLLKIYSLTDREDVLQILTEYSKNGKILHWRNFILPDIVKLVNEEEDKYTNFFEWCVTLPELIYWGIDGLLKTKGKKAFVTLIDLAKNENLKVSIRAKSIKSISLYSKQLFDRNLPKDPGYWELEDLRIGEVERWQKNGYQEGQGYSKPETHVSLENPKTEFEKIVSKLNKKLEAKRSKSQDLSNPTNWLIIAKEKDILRIEKKWRLPKNYLLFLRNYSPLNVFIDSKKYFQGLHLYGAPDLIKRQDGYSFNSITNKTIDDWPKNLVVIADAGADPYCIDINKIKNNDAPIYTSIHGEGEWDFKLYANSFQTFLKEIAGK